MRELKEELGINVKKEQLYLWATISSIKKKRYLFQLRLKITRQLKLAEGASMGYFTLPEMLRKKNVVNSLRLLLLIKLLTRFFTP